MPTIHARSEWTRRAPKYSTPLRAGVIKIVDVHWPASKGRIGGDQTRIVSALQGWQRMHMDEKRWSDIAYNIGVDLNGHVWILRGWDVQDGGVAGRSDDVTILGILGDQDTVTDAMKSTILWVMAEFERRRGPLRRTYHGALKSTDCPGPQLTAWAKAGFPAPNTTPQEEEMTPDERAMLVQIRDRVMGGLPAGSAVGRVLPDGKPARVMDSADGDYLRTLQIATAEKLGVDVGALPDKIKEAVAAATAAQAAALMQVAEQMRLTIETAGEQIATEARDRLTAQLRDLEVTLRPEVTQ